MARFAFLVAVLLGSFWGVKCYNITSTSGASGDVCGDGPQCLGDGTAICVGGRRCKCKRPTFRGFGHFVCRRRREVVCMILNDPLIIGYDGSEAFSPLNCKFKPTHLMMPICDTSDPDHAMPKPEDGSCDVKVFCLFFFCPMVFRFSGYLYGSLIVAVLYIASPLQGDLRLSGPPSGQDAGGGSNP
ncbi:hypothetical protein PoB_003579000 [Plakobranchus ocellatus]|uniref:EB domain-containing protein n=1 Tax=Plakobranchus ocellatus TaxID=259542 RepID=A0AAV4AQY3_9GAST|nr:hypothetical protein PoB_003579000 [Plakobranchus ocellatus]